VIVKIKVHVADKGQMKKNHLNFPSFEKFSVSVKFEESQRTAHHSLSADGSMSNTNSKERTTHLFTDKLRVTLSTNMLESLLGSII
jgi:hypothetical protein